MSALRRTREVDGVTTDPALNRLKALASQTGLRGEELRLTYNQLEEVRTMNFLFGAIANEVSEASGFAARCSWDDEAVILPVNTGEEIYFTHGPERWRGVVHASAGGPSKQEGLVLETVIENQSDDIKLLASVFVLMASNYEPDVPNNLVADPPADGDATVALRAARAALQTVRRTLHRTPEWQVVVNYPRHPERTLGREVDESLVELNRVLGRLGL